MEGVTFLYIDRYGALTDACKRAFDHFLGESHPLGSQFRFETSELGNLSGDDARYDCIMSPANSFGRLDGGYDYYLAEEVAPPGQIELPTAICQQALYNRWLGYAPTGTCTLVSLLNTPCEHNRHGCAYIALCPTMRTPETIKWARDIVYECTWSLLVEILRHNRSLGPGQKRINKVLMTGLGTGTGGVSVERCAYQTTLAVRDFSDSCSNPTKWSSLEWNQIDEIDRPLKESRDL